MTAVEALKAARSANVHIGLDGMDLVLRAPAPPPAAVLDALKRHKPGIVALLRLGRDNWSAAEWEAFFYERAGIAEHDGGLSRQEAEALGFQHCVVEWLMRHPVQSKPGVCLGCGRGDEQAGIVLPFGTKANGHAWLHAACWPDWYARRRAEAVAALAAMNIGIRVQQS